MLQGVWNRPVPYILLLSLVLAGCGRRKQEPQRKEDLLQRAKALVQERRYDEALKVYEQIVETNPQQAAVAYADMAFIHCEQRDYSVAVDEATKAIEKDDTLAEAYATLGLAYFRVNRVSEAVEQLKHAIRLNPKQARARTTLGVVYLQRRELEKAADSLRSAVSASARLPEANYNLALVLFKQARRKSAEQKDDPAEDRREARKYFRAYLKLRSGSEQRDGLAREYLRQIEADMEADSELAGAGAK